MVAGMPVSYPDTLGATLKLELHGYSIGEPVLLKGKPPPVLTTRAVALCAGRCQRTLTTEYQGGVDQAAAQLDAACLAAGWAVRGRFERYCPDCKDREHA